MTSLPLHGWTSTDSAATSLRWTGGDEPRVSPGFWKLRAAELEAELQLLRREEARHERDLKRIDEEQRLAARLQQDFLPKRLPQIGPVTFHTLYTPAGYVSGDLYDVARLDEQNVGVYIADAVGHGIPAALLTMFMRNALLTKRITATGYELVPPSQTMANLNRSLVQQQLDGSQFATALYSRINCQTLEMTFARGGHPSPVLLRADGTIEMPQPDGGLLGVFEDDGWSESQVQLRPGDRCFFYTDGIELAFNGGERIASERWLERLRETRQTPLPQVLAEFAKDMASTAQMPGQDDLTIVAFDIAE